MQCVPRLESRNKDLISSRVEYNHATIFNVKIRLAVNG